MATITLKHVSKSYDNKVTVIPDLNLEIRDREFLILVGPSGCGKSTTLRMIAGLEDVSGGELLIGDKLVNDVPPKDRDIAMVFQSYALYPHMSVYKNMAFGLKLRKMPKEEIDRKVRDAARILDIEDYLERKPKALSGGQRQRVALGRAMVRQPSVFLLDEPLSNLDAKLRTEMRSQITKLHKDLQTTFVYVTHDQTEAMTMADRIVVMKDGHVLQVDTPHNLYHNPANVFVAGFIGSPRMNLIPARLEQGMGGPAIVFGGCKTDLPEAVAKRLDFEAYQNKEILLGVRPEDFHMPDEFVAEASTDNVELYVHLAEMMGSEIYLYSRLDGTEVIAKVPSSAGIRSYDTVKLSVDMARIHLFDKVTEESILVPGDDLAYNREGD